MLLGIGKGCVGATGLIATMVLSTAGAVVDKPEESEDSDSHRHGHSHGGHSHGHRH